MLGLGNLHHMIGDRWLSLEPKRVKLKRSAGRKDQCPFNLERISQIALPVVRGVVETVLPQLITVLPWQLSRLVNLRILSIVGFGWYCSTENRTWIDTAIATVSLTVTIIALIDMAGFVPALLAYRLAVDAILLLAALIGSAHVLVEGIAKMRIGLTAPNMDEAARITHVVSGALLIATGTLGFASTCYTAHRLVKGVRIFQKMDPMQQEAVLKHRALQYLHGEKACRAVIIDGCSSKWGGFADDTAFPSGEAVYEHCATRTYRVNSEKEFREALANASQHLGGPIDALFFHGHANNQVQSLGSHYYFTASDHEAASMRQYLSKTAQVFSLGCNTATQTPGVLVPLAERIAKKVPGREVTGIAAYLNPFLSSTSFNGRFKIQSYFPAKLGTWRIGNFISQFTPTVPLNAKTYLFQTT